MIIDAISNGIVIDHISAGKAMKLYNILGLDKLDCSVALLKNVSSGKLGRKDIIKIDRVLDLDWDVISMSTPASLSTSLRTANSPKSASSSCPSASQTSFAARIRAASPPLSRSCRRSSR